MFLLLLVSWSSCGAQLPPLAEALKSGTDVWGEAARRQPDGASYEFFAPLLPPPRYVHADFRFYPMVLSAPGAKTKARLISNGSGVNLRGGSRSWKDAGVPVVFRVGTDEFRFGDLRERVSEPQPLEGWLPVYAVTFRHPSAAPVMLDPQATASEAEVYRMEAFVSTDAAVAENAVVFVRFSLEAGTSGVVSVKFTVVANACTHGYALNVSLKPGMVPGVVPRKPFWPVYFAVSRSDGENW